MSYYTSCPVYQQRSPIDLKFDLESVWGTAIRRQLFKPNQRCLEALALNHPGHNARRDASRAKFSAVHMTL
jgi:hypothetical protein